MRIRVGMGYDVHRLVEGRDLWLGGIKLEHTMGLLGHSDADVLIHAICDAMLGAANMRDIGFHFPDTSERTLDIDSKVLLRDTVALIATKGYKPDITFLFDVDVEVGQSRVGKNKDRLEKEGLEFHHNVKNGYLELAKQNPNRIKVINSNLGIDEVFEQVEKIIKEIL